MSAPSSMAMTAISVVPPGASSIAISGPPNVTLPGALEVVAVAQSHAREGGQFRHLRREVPKGCAGESTSECLAIDASHIAHEFRCFSMALDVEGRQMGRGEASDVFEHAQVAATQGHAASVL